MTYPQQPYQPPVVSGAHGYSQQPPMGDWTPPQPKSRLMPWLIAALALSVLTVGGLLFVLFRGADPVGTANALVGDAGGAGATFERIEESCGVVAGYRIDDSGRTLIMTVGGAYMNPDTMTCVYDRLGMPAAVREHIGTTRALDGQQTDAWADYTARWTYHPDSGLNITIQQR